MLTEVCEHCLKLVNETGTSLKCLKFGSRFFRCKNPRKLTGLGVFRNTQILLQLTESISRIRKEEEEIEKWRKDREIAKKRRESEKAKRAQIEAKKEQTSLPVVEHHESHDTVVSCPTPPPEPQVADARSQKGLVVCSIFFLRNFSKLESH